MVIICTITFRFYAILSYKKPKYILEKIIIITDKKQYAIENATIASFFFSLYIIPIRIILNICVIKTHKDKFPNVLVKYELIQNDNIPINAILYLLFSSRQTYTVKANKKTCNIETAISIIKTTKLPPP